MLSPEEQIQTNQRSNTLWGVVLVLLIVVASPLVFAAFFGTIGIAARAFLWMAKAFTG